MKKMLLSSAVAAALFATCFACACLSGGRASAQQPMGPGVQSPSAIALVDVNYVFKKHVRLKAQLTDLQADAAKVQKEFEQQLQRLQEQQQQLSQLKPGTPDYAHLEESLVSQQAMIKGQIALKRKEFVQKEAHLYFNAYHEICDQVAYFCQQRGIALVLNFNGDNIHEENPDDIARGITNKVVFYNKTLDITPFILESFSKPLPPANGGPVGFNPSGIPPR